MATCRECFQSVRVDGELGYDPRARRAFVRCNRCNTNHGPTDEMAGLLELQNAVVEVLVTVSFDRVLAQLARVAGVRAALAHKESDGIRCSAYKIAEASLTALSTQLRRFS